MPPSADTHGFSRSVLAAIVVAGLTAVSATAGAAVCAINSLVTDPPSPNLPSRSALLVVACILCFCAPAACAWKRLEHTGLFPPMATTAYINRQY
ncbi:hypothetical protein DFH08DRAFT_949875 [Mycena albidolilacea]|uniref:Uncharacterized protein n=1 Tax=Mycena albidolilacea TaxID=1033008 RepID=A0AAD7F230_9AGAR|nr:hypothetical protein DFH08DRAFT_949875 [Mycena albidolilacea]